MYSMTVANLSVTGKDLKKSHALFAYIDWVMEGEKNDSVEYMCGFVIITL